MDRQTKPAAGGIRSAGRENCSPAQSSTARLTLDLRTAIWTRAEAAALDRRRSLAELRRRHLKAAVSLYGRDNGRARWHVERMAELHRGGGCHGRAW
jgi:hypothetical protein